MKLRTRLSSIACAPLLLLMHWWICFIWPLVPPGSCYITVNPMNMTTCWNSSTYFLCAINETKQIYWLINGQQPAVYNLISPGTTGSNLVPGAQSTLIMPGSYELNGALITCYYNPVPPQVRLYSTPAFLQVQGPPLNLTATLIGGGLMKFSWIQSTEIQIGSFLDYIVLVKDGNGVVVHNETVRNSQLIINTSDPCGQYIVSVAPVCQGTVSVASIVGSQIPGVPPSNLSNGNVVTTLAFSNLPTDNVTVNISIFQSGVCNYHILIKSELGGSSQLLERVLQPSSRTQPHNFALSLHPNQHLNFSITASNRYGNISFGISVSTHSVIAVNLSTASGTEIKCTFHAGSPAIGCLINITNMANAITYCIALQRYSNVSLSVLLVCQSQNVIFDAGRYLVHVYDIERDGEISTLPAVIEEILLVTSRTIVVEPSVSPPMHSPTPNDSRWHLNLFVIGTASSVPTFLVLVLIVTAFCICALCKKKVSATIGKCEVTEIQQERLSETSKQNFTSSCGAQQINLGCCIAYASGSTEPIKLSQTDFDYYRVVFLDILVNIKQLRLEPRPIGEGAFGVVYGGTIQKDWDCEAVAVKTVKELYSRSDIEQFFDECCRMKAFKHPNVVELIGMCLDSPDGFPLMILPLYLNGNLKTYLQKSRGFSSMVTKLPEGLSTYILIGMCLDIAQGMEYLSKKGFVHRDLAARNCMVDLSLSVKVGDFGLARDTSYQASNAQKCPVKWMPPEMLQDGISNEKTDVWAFGVASWEIFSLGAAPYPGVENNEMLELLCKGVRLKKPKFCPSKMFMLIERCWNNDSQKRPSFLELVSKLQEGLGHYNN